MRISFARAAMLGSVAVAAIIVGLVMLTLSLVAPKSYATIRGAALDVTAPITGALREVVTTTTGIVSGAGDYWNAAQQNGELKRQRAAMMRRMVEAKAITLENAELKRALALRERDRRTVATGRIVGSSFDSPRRFAVLSIGSSDGVQVGMPVRAADGTLLCYEGHVQDVTQRKQAELALAASREELRNHRDHLEEMVAARTADLRILNAQLREQVSEREHAETALRESQDRIIALIDSVSDVVSP